MVIGQQQTARGGGSTDGLDGGGGSSWFIRELPPSLGVRSSTLTSMTSSVATGGCVPTQQQLRVEHLGGEECAFLFDEVFTRQAYLAGGWLRLPLRCLAYGQRQQQGSVTCTVVDCGANIGLFSLWCIALCAGGGTEGGSRGVDVDVVAIEPAPPCCEVLRRNLAHYTAATSDSSGSSGSGTSVQVQIIPCGLVGPAPATAAAGAAVATAGGEASGGAGPDALGEDLFVYDASRPGETYRECYTEEAAAQRHVMGDDDDDVGGAASESEGERGQDSRRQTFRVQTRTLSSVLWGADGVWGNGGGAERAQAQGRGRGREQDGRRRRIDLLKIDVEGDELEVLRGIAADDWPLIEQIALEVHDREGRLGKVEALLRQQGYAVRTEAQRSQVRRLRIYFVAEPFLKLAGFFSQIYVRFDLALPIVESPTRARAFAGCCLGVGFGAGVPSSDPCRLAAVLRLCQEGAGRRRAE